MKRTGHKDIKTGLWHATFGPRRFFLQTVWRALSDSWHSGLGLFPVRTQDAAGRQSCGASTMALVRGLASPVLSRGRRGPSLSRCRGLMDGFFDTFPDTPIFEVGERKSLEANEYVRPYAAITKARLVGLLSALGEYAMRQMPDPPSRAGLACDPESAEAYRIEPTP